MTDGKIIAIYLLMLKPKRMSQIVQSISTRDAITIGKMNAAQRFACGFFPFEISDSLLLNQLTYELMKD